MNLYDEVLDSTEMKDRFIAWLKSRENYKMVSLPSVDIVTFSFPQPQAATSTSQSSIKGFIHWRKIRQNAVLGYFLDDDGHWKVQLQPIPGRYWHHALIKDLLAESSLLPDDQNEKFVRVDYMGSSSKFQSRAASSSSSQSQSSTSNYFTMLPVQPSGEFSDRNSSSSSVVRSRSWFFRTRTLLSDARDVVLGLFRNREPHRSIALPSVDTVSFSYPYEFMGNEVCGFIRSNGVDVAESAVRDWLPGPGPDSSLVFEWTPIHGCFRKNNLIKSFFSDIQEKDNSC